MATLVFFGLFFLASLFVNATFTYGAAKLLKVQNGTWSRAFIVATINVVVPLHFLALGYASGAFDRAPALLLAAGVAILLFPLFVYRKLYRATGKQLLGFVGMQAALCAVNYAIAYPVKLYAVEAFVIPTNSMAPNISGHRVEGRCTECQGKVVMTVDDPPPLPEMRREPPYGTCIRCGKEFDEKELDGRPLRGDKIAVTKWYEPERWDAVVFRYPKDPSIKYVKRVVGLPGETVIIDDDGFLHVDGRRVEPPAEFAEVRYSTSFPNNPRAQAMDGGPLRGTPERPMKLGPDEYFMLGDNTYRALDARFWGPVKRDAVIGTATLIYWPPNRWRIFK